MADDFVKDISPLNQIAPVRPHPSNIRQERRGRGKRQGTGKRKDKRDSLEDSPLCLKDKVSVFAKGHDDLQAPHKSDRKNSKKDDNKLISHIDIRV